MSSNKLKRGKSTSKTTKARLKPASRINRPLAGLFILAFAAIGTVLIIRSLAYSPPPSGGYFSLVAAGQFSNLPSDSQAAAMVHHSPWEPRPENNTANHTVPPSTFTTAGYGGMVNHAQVFGRVTGNFTGTTDEIIQWVAAKWGLPDDLIRAEAVGESSWYQGVKDNTGYPVANKGYGDFGACGGSPAPSGYGINGPASFGLLQNKWCAQKDSTAAGYGTWPWSERSTAYSVDVYGAIIRGCFEGWDTWLGSTYHAGDLWGCVGRWYAGAWHTADADGYSSRIRTLYDTKPWLNWPDLAVADTTPPSAPTNLAVNVSSTSQANLSWSAATDNVGVTGYMVYRNGVPVTTVATISYADTSILAGTTYMYYVKAVDAAGNTGINSNSVTVTTPAPNTAPSPTPTLTDTTPPTISITTPASGATINNRYVYISAHASDNVSVTKMELYIDGSLRSTVASSTLNYNWNTRKLLTGTHTITLKAYDAVRNVGNASRTIYK
jgi:hypothetical protein